MSTIPASFIVTVTPNVLAAAGRALEMIGLMLTSSTRIPIGAIQRFESKLDVQTYFGSGSTEATAAEKYFLGFTNSAVKPGAVLMAQYNAAAVAAWLRGGQLGLTLAQLNAVPAGTMSITSNGVVKTSASIDLSGATSFSNAAALITAAFTSPGFAVTYDSISGAFLVTSSSTGPTSTLTFASNVSGTIATALKLTSATGAVLSQGAAAASPAAFMDSVVAQNQNWAAFCTLFDPDVSGNANKFAFAEWTGDQVDRYAYVCWDTDAGPSASAPDADSLGALIAAAAIGGTFLIGRDAVGAVDQNYAAFALGIAPSLNFGQLNGRATYAFRRQSGLVATVSSESAAANLIANGYNFYGAVATANDEFIFLYDGEVSGDFQWMDSYINQIWLNNALQLALMNLLVQERSIPYNEDGYALIEAAVMDPVLAAVDFGAIRAGVTLSELQRASVNNAAGIEIDQTLETRGWYFQVRDADPVVRQARASPPCTLWYMDGQSVQKIDLTSVNVQ